MRLTAEWTHKIALAIAHLKEQRLSQLVNQPTLVKGDPGYTHPKETTGDPLMGPMAQASNDWKFFTVVFQLIFLLALVFLRQLKFILEKCGRIIFMTSSTHCQQRTQMLGSISRFNLFMVHTPWFIVQVYTREYKQQCIKLQSYKKRTGNVTSVFSGHLKCCFWNYWQIFACYFTVSSLIYYNKTRSRH